MNKIQNAFTRGKALIPFLTCGDPTLDITEQLVMAMERAGADLIQLGIPFSDPTAEGETLQTASIRALSRGVTTEKVFDMIRNVRKNSRIPLVITTYANVVFSYGTEKFVQTIAQIGVDGLILPDVPLEEKEEFDAVCKKYDVDFISMIAATSKERVAKIAQKASGFIYCASAVEMTDDTCDKIASDMKSMVALVKQVREIPCVAGVGVSTPDQAREIAKFSDGIIVDSTIIELCGQYGKDCVSQIESYVRTMKNAVQNL